MKCNHDKTTLDYSEEHDSYFCAKCNEWLENDCKDTKCEYCKNRPDKPLKDNE